jgi:hypothetical protein
MRARHRGLGNAGQQRRSRSTTQIGVAGRTGRLGRANRAPHADRKARPARIGKRAGQAWGRPRQISILMTLCFVGASSHQDRELRRKNAGLIGFCQVGSAHYVGGRSTFWSVSAMRKARPANGRRSRQTGSRGLGRPRARASGATRFRTVRASPPTCAGKQRRPPPHRAGLAAHVRRQAAQLTSAPCGPRRRRARASADPAPVSHPATARRPPRAGASRELAEMGW